MSHEPSQPSSSPGSDEGRASRLDSWKDIAAYLKRDVSTVQRWERREGMPVHRHLHEKQGTVYAFRGEIDAWWQHRRLLLDEKLNRGAEAEAVHLPSDLVGNGGAVAVTPASTQKSIGGRHLGWGKWLMASGLTAIAVGSIAYGTLTRPANSPSPEIRSLVVLPLENLSADSAQEFFAVGMTDELIGTLAQVRALRVVSRTSAMSLKGSSKSLPAIARELNVDGVLAGSVQRAGERVRIRMQLLHAPTDTYVWAREYERDLTDVLKLQAEVARAVAEEVRVQITPEERARMAAATTVNPTAHEEYLLGRYLLWKFIEEDRLRAVDHFNRAIQIDPDYAAPYAGLAHAWWMRGVLGPLSLKEVAPPSRAAAQKALELDDRLAEAIAAKAYVEGMFDWDWVSAEKTIRHAVEIDPNSLDAHYVYALLLMALGRLDEAVSEIEYAAQLDPLSAQVHSTFGRILFRARRFDEAIARLNRAIELEPRNAVTWSRLGDVHDQIGSYSEALGFYEKSLALLNNARNGDHEGIARVYAHMGKVSEARGMLRRLGDGSPAVYVALGEKDAAFRLLFKSVDERIDWNLYLKADPSFEDLHSDPRWEDLLGRMKLPVGSAN